MFQKNHIEKILRLNGLEPTASDEEIKSILISARWHADDVDAAILVLRENTVTHQTHIDSLHKVFQSDDRLRPETISALLGIEMDLPATLSESKKKGSQSRLSSQQIMNITIVSLSLSLIFVLAAMWYLKMGIFHQTYL